MASVVAIDLGGTNIKGARVGQDGAIQARGWRKTVTDQGASGVLSLIADLINELKTPDVAGAAIGSPGVVDPDSGICCSTAFNLPGWDGLELAKEIRERTGLPTLADNDANLAGLGEYWLGAGRGEKLVLIYTIGTGIGGGIVMDGKIFHGGAFRGVEFGIISVDADSSSSLGGVKGAVECFASATAIIADARRRLTFNPKSLMLTLAGGDINKIDAKIVCDADKAGDPDARIVLDTAMKYLSCAIGTMINVMNPTTVIISGGVAKAGDGILNRVKNELESGRAYAPILKQCTIRLGELGDDAGILGGAKRALETFVR